jgi:polyisoprenoid-binding protein YceI
VAETSSTAAARRVVGRWEIDTEHSSVRLTVRSFGFIPVRCTVPVVAGEVVGADRPNRTHVTARLDPAGFHTGNAKRDQHVTSSDFLDVEGFPDISFRAVDLRWSEHDPAAAEIDGELTVRGVTCLVTLTARVDEQSDADGVGVTATTAVRRSAFGVTAMRGVVGDVVRVRLGVRLRRPADPGRPEAEEGTTR